MGLGEALLSCGLVAGAYVGSLYVWRSRGLARDDPEVIKRRFVSCAAVSSVSWIPLYLESRGRGPLLPLLGLRAEGLVPGVVLPLAAMATLFLGPLVMAALDGWELGWQAPRVDIVFIRNIVVAPATEEFVFRACMAPLLRLNGVSLVGTVFLTPVFFGAAHLHHFRELVVHGGCSLGRAGLISAVQFAYTSLFGWIATYLLLRTGQLPAALATHAFCNLMGLPDFAGAARHRRKRVVLAAYAAGLVGFGLVLGHATDPALYYRGEGARTGLASQVFWP